MEKTISQVNLITTSYVIRFSLRAPHLSRMKACLIYCINLVDLYYFLFRLLMASSVWKVLPTIIFVILLKSFM